MDGNASVMRCGVWRCHPLWISAVERCSGLFSSFGQLELHGQYMQLQQHSNRAREEEEKNE